MSDEHADMQPLVHITEAGGIPLPLPQTINGSSDGKIIIENEMLPLAGLLSHASDASFMDSTCTMFTATLPAHFAGSLPEGTVLQLSPETGVVTVTSLPVITGQPIVVGENTRRAEDILHSSQEPVFSVLQTKQNSTEIDLSSLLTEEEPCSDPECFVVPQLTLSPSQESSPARDDSAAQVSSSTTSATDAETNNSTNAAGNQSVVTIDVTKPIQLCQNSLIVVNGQKCVLQHNPDTGQVVAYPVKEPEKPRKKRGRPKKTTQLSKFDEEPENSEQQMIDNDDDQEEDEVDSGLIHITNEDGSLVKRSRRKRKKAAFLQDYETGNLRGEIGSDEEANEREMGADLDSPPKKMHRGRGRPRKAVTLPQQFNPFPFLNQVKRRRGRPRRYHLDKEPMQGFLIQMADGQSLMMQIPTSSLPKDMSLQEVAQNIAQCLNAAAQVPPITQSGAIPTTDSMAISNDSSQVNRSESLVISETLTLRPPPQTVVKKRGRPKKNVLTHPYHAIAPAPPILKSATSTTPNIVLLNAASPVVESMSTENSIPGPVQDVLRLNDSDGACNNEQQNPEVTEGILDSGSRSPLTAEGELCSNNDNNQEEAENEPLPTEELHPNVDAQLTETDSALLPVEELCADIDRKPVETEDVLLPAEDISSNNSSNREETESVPEPLFAKEENCDKIVSETQLVSVDASELQSISTDLSCNGEIKELIANEQDSEPKQIFLFQTSVIVSDEMIKGDSAEHSFELIGSGVETLTQEAKPSDVKPDTAIPTTVIPVPDSILGRLLKQESPIKLGLKATGPELDQLRCSKCDFQAFYQKQYQEHLTTHEDTEKCKCCKFVSLTEEDIVKHYKENHSRYICHVCNYTAERPYLIRRHMSQHDGSCCTCDICGKSYKDNYILGMHVKLVHMPLDVVFECDICHKKFNRKAHLKRHLRTHAANRPYKCNFCIYRGCEKSDITKHMLIHQEPKHSCDICGKAFRHIKNKELHMKRHKGQRDYKCGVCDFYGYTFTDIRKHIERRHTDAKTVICDVCGQAFKTDNLLKEHKEANQCEVFLNSEVVENEGVTYAEDDSEVIEPSMTENTDGQFLTGSIVLSDGTVAQLDSLQMDEDGHIILNQEEAEALAQSGQLTILTGDSNDNSQVALIAKGDDYEGVELQEADVSCGKDVACSQPVAVMTSDGLMLHVVV